MATLVHLIDAGRYGEAITVAYSGRYGAQEFGGVGGRSGKPCDTISGKVPMGAQYNLGRAIRSLDLSVQSWLLWCYDTPLGNEGKAQDAIIAQLDAVALDELVGCVAYSKAIMLMNGLMNNLRAQHLNGSVAYSNERIARYLGIDSRRLRSGEGWGRVKRAYENRIDKFDQDCIDLMAQTLDGFAERAAG